MILTVLGSGSIFPDPSRGGASYLVSRGHAALLLDAGPGSMRSLVRSGGDPARLEGACITHRHPDHTSELRLLLDLQISLGRRLPFLLAGPAILDEFLRFHLSWGRERPKQLPYPLDRLVLPGEGGCGPFRILGAEVQHVDHSVGLRVSAGERTVVYAGDCGPDPAVIDLARGADALVLENTLAPGEESPAHLTTRQAAEIALQAGCRKLILSHFSPGSDPDAAVALCRKAGVDAVAAYDGMRLEV